MQGRTVRLYLVDGGPNGTLTAEIMNWTGKFTVAPRAQLTDLVGRDEVKRTGIYVLTGDNPDNPAQSMVYIGESDNVWKRLVNHNNDPDKYFWQRTIVVTSKDENLTKAHVRYLESRLIQLTTMAQRARLANANNPEPLILPESDRADMEYFLDQILMLLPVLGFSFASPLPAPDNSGALSQAESPMLRLTVSGVDANAQEIGGEIILLKGSTIRKKYVPSLSSYYIQVREQLLKDGKLAESDNPDYWITTQNIPFSSISAAATVVAGTRLNGRITWRLKDTEQTYAEWQESKIEQAEPSDAEDE